MAGWCWGSGEARSGPAWLPGLSGYQRPQCLGSASCLPPKSTDHTYFLFTGTHFSLMREGVRLHDFQRKKRRQRGMALSCARLYLSEEETTSFIQSSHLEFKVPQIRSWQTFSGKGHIVSYVALWPYSLWQQVGSAVVTVLGTTWPSVCSWALEDMVPALRTSDDFQFYKFMDQGKVSGVNQASLCQRSWFQGLRA